jgi:hypothetical protein
VRHRTERIGGKVHPVIFEGGCHEQNTQDGSSPQGGCMSKSSRYEWRDQQAALHERMKGFLANPSNEQLEAVVAEMRAYADAAQSGNIEIPQRWTAYS